CRPCNGPLRLFSLVLISPHGVQFPDDFAFMILGAHVPPCPRGHSLLFHGGAPPVPVNLLVVADIPQGRAASRQLFLSCANGYGQSAVETVLVHVRRPAGPAPSAAA